MDRRKFLTVSAAAGVTPLAGAALAAEASATAPREYLLLEQYQIETAEQKNRFDAYLRDAAIPALNRQGIKPVGVFYPDEGFATVYVLLHDKSLEKLLSVQDQLLCDAEYCRKGADVLDAIRDNPGFKRLESTVLLAFKGMPGVERPESGPGRVFQLRIYESPSVRTNRKKISMFNDAGEIAACSSCGSTKAPACAPTARRSRCSTTRARSPSSGEWACSRCSTARRSPAAKCPT
jgi:hypothetical protein